MVEGAPRWLGGKVGPQSLEFYSQGHQFGAALTLYNQTS